MVTDINNDTDFYQEVFGNEQLTVIDFYAPWCGPCKMYGTVFDKIASEVIGAKLVKANIEHLEDSISELGVMGVPATLFIKNNEVVFRHSGILYEERLNNLISEHK